MSRDPVLVRPGEAYPPGLVADERGAILVLGIFMCACMVGLLWYLAGIGDAMLYRERMQEASDATAFSTAVLHARGMNLIVMLNLVMACILAIRVALKILQIIFGVLAIIFGLISLLPFGIGAWAVPIAAFCSQGVNVTQQAINNTRNLINNTIKALHTVQKGIAKVVPPASIAGSLQVGSRYKSVVKQAAALGPGTVFAGLPVEDDSPDKLCEKAGEATAHIITAIFDLGSIGDRIEGMTGDLVRAGGAYFCEIGSGSSTPPDLSSITDQMSGDAEEGCRQQRDGLSATLAEAQAAYDTKCSSMGTLCTAPPADTSTLTPEEQQDLEELNALSLDRDGKQAEYDQFNFDQCVQDSKNQASESVQNALSQQSSSGSSTQGMVPMKVLDDWKNGDRRAQMIGLSWGDTSFLEYAPKLVKIGAWQDEVEVDVPTSADYDLSQAEFFYDCSGAWSGGDCKDKEPMWHFRWRARLRRWSAPFSENSEVAARIAGAVAGSEAYVMAVQAFELDTLNHRNVELYADLLKAADPKDIIIH